MRHNYLLIALAFLTAFIPALPASAKPDAVIESSYTVGEDHYRLRATLRWATSARFGPNTIAMHYSVYRNDTFLHPSSLGGGVLLGGAPGRRLPIESQVTIQVIDDFGWQVNMGAILGNTFSDNYTYILPVSPTSREYLQNTFIAKYDPILRRDNDRIEVWSCYQEWGGGGTAFSFFVPELRVISRTGRGVRIQREALPADLTTWPELEYVGTLAKFVAGLSQFNPDLMEAVNHRFEADDIEALQHHELPETPEARQALINAIRQTANLRDQFNHFELQWHNSD